MNEENDVTISLKECIMVDSTKVVLHVEIKNNLQNNSIIFIVDPWIKEGWDVDGPKLAFMVDQSSTYPFVQLIDDFQKGQGDVGREYAFDSFKNFVRVEENKVLHCILNLSLHKSYIEKISKSLQLLIVLPYAKEKIFLENYTNEQQVIQSDSVTLSFVGPNKYKFYEGRGKRLSDVFTFTTGLSGEYPVEMMEEAR